MLKSDKILEFLLISSEMWTTQFIVISGFLFAPYLFGQVIACGMTFLN